MNLLFPLLAEQTQDSFLEDLQNFGSKLIPNLPAFIIQLCAFIILIIAAIFIFYKPLRKKMKMRKEYVTNNISQSEANLRDSITKNEEATENVKASKKQAQEIIEQANRDGERIKSELIAEGKAKADQELELAKARIESEVEKAQDEIHKEIVDVAIVASEKLLEREVNSKDNEKLIDDFVNDVKKGKK